MKKVILVATVFLSALSISCSSDDDAAGQDPIIAKWFSFSEADIVDGVVGTAVEDSACEKRGSLEFKADGTYVSTPYIEDNGECIIDGITNGTWENSGNGKYQFKFGTSDNEASVEFKDNTLIITSSESVDTYSK
ncbi:lipocalin family protein [Aquimarina algiphila]|uniref:lipocalin family protein n=1 Tax=Aquimarina algiphila TaxID=2047982 RepID=UPI00232CA4D6|nr:lipocalin family protein [Aquimarina algiphila]